MTITNRQLRKALEAEGLGDINLEKDDGYFYIWSDERVIDLYDNSICVCHFNQCTIGEWVDEIKRLLAQNRA